MKRRYPIGLFLLLALLAACTKAPEPVEGPSPELQQAVAYFDSLLMMADGADTRGVSLQGAGRRDARRASAKNCLKL